MGRGTGGSHFLLSVSFYSGSVVATTRYHSEAEHISVVIFVSSRKDSLMFARFSVFPREQLPGAPNENILAKYLKCHFLLS